MGRKRDQIWEYVEELSGRFKCKFCERNFAGGASRIKLHLAGLKGHDIDICKNVTEDVQEKAYLAIVGPNKKHKSASTSNNAEESAITSISTSKIKEGKTVLQSMEEYTIELVLNVVVEGLLAKVRSFVTEHISFEKDFKEELVKLLISLTEIQVMLHDIMKWQVIDDSVRILLAKFKEVAYDAESMVDEFGYEILLQKVQTQNQMNEKVPSFSPFHPVVFSHNMAILIKGINQSLDEFIDHLRVVFVDYIPKISLDKEVESLLDDSIFQKIKESLLDDSKVVGREYDVLKIVHLLTNASSQQVISVLPIVGMAGIGKTTLAKLVYNNALIKSEFDVKIWVCVTENFDVSRILREILKSLGKFLIGLNGDYVVLQSLRKKLRGKKYLLILDDMWNKDLVKWDILWSYLLEIDSNTGNNIIVTIRSDNVAQNMETFPRPHFKKLETLPYHDLEKLSKDECWSIFKKRAFANERVPRTPDFEAIGREIAKKCGGVPLAANILGGTMFFKNDINEWRSIQNNKIWDSVGHDNGVFAALKLCFDHLPTPSLKQCFVFCAIFPKNHCIEKEELIQFWMAEGFLQPSQGSPLVMEDIGGMYFDILLVNSLLQDVEKDMYDNITKCKMHDLVHDHAVSILRSDKLILDADSMDNINHVRRLFIESDVQTVSRIPFTKDEFTFVLKNVAFGDLLNFKHLRTLKLSGCSITELPDSIGRLIQLRFLCISDTVIELLPKSITNLYNLQTLRIEYCHRLKELPEDLRNLISLRHIYVDHDVIVRTPKDIGWLTCLQTLPFFTVDLNIGCQLKELGGLNLLRGELNIYGLEHVRDKKEAQSANLSTKPKLYKLGFYWGRSNHKNREGNNNDEEVLEGLQPHFYLKSLTIVRFRGDKFPSWMLTGSHFRSGLLLFDNLIEINFKFCSKCEGIPTLGHLPCLKVLKIIGMHNVEHIGVEFYGKYNSGNCKNTLFPALRRFKLMSMDNLVEWKDALELTTQGEVFPCLENLSIGYCGRMKSAPCHFQSLKELRISNMSSTSFEKIGSKLTMLKFLYISEVFELTILPAQLLQNNSNLMSLQIKSCPKLVSISPHQDVWEFCTSLRSLKIEDCKKLSCLPDLHGLQSLKKLELQSCPNLRSFPSGLQSCTSLSILRIEECPNLASIPDLRELPSLVELQIRYCGSLKHFTEEHQDVWGFSTSLQSLKIEDYTKLSYLPALHTLQYLTELKVQSCPNLRSFPAGLQSCTSLSILRIEDCPNLASIPDLRELPSLIKLQIRYCRSLKHFTEEHQDVWGFCTSLQSLKIKDCNKLSYLPALHTLQYLTKLEVQSCPNLRSFPSIQGASSHLQCLRISCGIDILPVGLQYCTSLSILSMEDCPNLVSIPNLPKLPSLIELRIKDCGSLKHFPKGLDFLTRLKDLSIGGFCEELDAFPSLNVQHLYMPLERLSLYGWANINLPNEIQHFIALRELLVEKFYGMIVLPEWLGNLSSLQKLSLWKCEKLMSLPQAMQRLTRLEMLDIRCCPRLKERCMKGSGIDWIKIVHIPNIKLDFDWIERKVY